MSIIFFGKTKSDSNCRYFFEKAVDNIKSQIKDEGFFVENDFCKFYFSSRKKTEYFNYSIINDDSERIVSVVYGRIYKKEGDHYPSCLYNLNYLDIKKIIFEKNYLSKNFWGNYIIFIFDHKKSSLMIFTDPQGSNSCFYYNANSYFLFSSDIWCIKDLIENTSINFKLFRSYINCSMGTLSLSEQTPFNEFSELFQGHYLSFYKNKISIDYFWNPFEISSSGNFAKEDIIPTFVDVMYNASADMKVCLELSGGLDSSSILLALSKIYHDHKEKITAVSFFNSNVSSSDERLYAKNLCDRENIKLYFQDWLKPWFLDYKHKKLERPDKPHTMSICQHLSKERENLFDNNDIIFISGHGGDHIFLESVTENSIADYWIDKSLKGIFHNLLSLCSLNRDNFFSLLKKNIISLKRYYLKSLQYPHFWNLSRPEWLVEDKNDQDHIYSQLKLPYESLTRGFKPGKFDHIVAILIGSNQYKIFNKYRKTPIIYPFLYQPMVELALLLNTYDSYSSKYYRAPFREEVSRFFNYEGAFRKSKGSTSGVLQIGLKQNMDRVLELCLEGYMCKNNMIKKDVLEKKLYMVKHGMISDLRSIFNLIAIELWVESWSI